MNHRSSLLSLLAAAALSAGPAFAGEPPIQDSLTCSVVSQDVNGSMRLQMRFDNQSATAIELPPGPYLVLYEDAQASDSMPGMARLDRMQRNAIHVDPFASRLEIFAVDARNTEALECNGKKPAAAALYFYKFSQRPRYRCILKDYKLDALGIRSDCPQQALWGIQPR